MAEVRGLGLMVGVELADAEMAAAVQQQLPRRRDDRAHLWAAARTSCGLIPPLTISDDEAELALAILERALTACC